MDLSVLTTYELWMARKRSINIRDEFLRHFNDAKEQVEEIERELRRRGADVDFLRKYFGRND